MKLKNEYKYSKASQHNTLAIIMRYVSHGYLCFFIITLAGCTDFVEVDPPKNTLVSETVFKDPETVKSALANIYYKMREQGMTSGNYGLSILMGIYSDELDYYGSDTNRLELYNHNVTASNSVLLDWWRQAYNLIYAANDILKGIEGSSNLSQDYQDKYKGQALFIRAYLHSLLADIYGDIPYITTTSYLENNVVTRLPVNMVYDHIIDDLEGAVSLLDEADETGEHVIPNKSVANALLARMYLYKEEWQLAATAADQVISTHGLESDVNDVFLKNSIETIWQFKPNPTLGNTQEAGWLIIRFIPTKGYSLTDNLLEAFEPGDLRFANWIEDITSDDGLTTLHYAYKYKETINTTTSSLEYSIVFRVAEQYLIRAEARVHLGNISGAQEDINAIRNRASLSNTLANTVSDLLEAVLQERQVELFTEHGQRWFDLKRLGKATEVLSPIKTNWQPNQVVLPIPDVEIGINPNLKPQNEGY